MRRELVKGDLPALILAVLNREPLHGYGIARAVERLSSDALTLREGTLYPALRVLEQDGLIVGTWETQDKGPGRKVYTLTEAGAKEMETRIQELRNYAALIQTVLEKLDVASGYRKRDGHAQTA